MHKNDIGIARSITKFSKKEIQNLFKKSYTILHKAEIDIKIAPKMENFGKILIITPKNIGNAPKRNLIRRRIKSIFYQEKMYNLGYDFIAFCKKGITNFGFEEIKNIFQSILTKIPSD
jgi:ribonuclease P protein component